MIRTVVIDDEPKSREVIRNILIDYFHNVQVLAVAGNADEAIRSIEANRPDLIFLDIEMPGGNGFKVLEAFPNADFKVIFVTAYSEYALKALKLSALDYLLKPVNIEELESAIAKYEHLATLRDNLRLRALSNVIKPAKPVTQIVLPVSQGYTVVGFHQIIRCEAERNYSRFFLSDGERILVSKKLGDFEELLKDEGFFRIHHSYLVNLAHVKKYIKGKAGYALMSDGTKLEIASRRKEDFLNALGAQ